MRFNPGGCISSCSRHSLFEQWENAVSLLRLQSITDSHHLRWTSCSARGLKRVAPGLQRRNSGDIKWWPASTVWPTSITKFRSQFKFSTQCNALKAIMANAASKYQLMPDSMGQLFCFPSCCNYHWTIPTSSVCFMSFLISILQKINFFWMKKWYILKYTCSY